MASTSQNDAEEITRNLADIGDWRGERLAQLRGIITAAVPGVEEAIKWRKPSNPRGVPTWSKDGLICTGEVYKDKVKITFAHGAAVADPTGIFNASMDAGTRRAVDIRETDAIDDGAFTALVQAAAAFNAQK